VLVLVLVLVHSSSAMLVLLVQLAAGLLAPATAMYMEGEMVTGENWVFMARFCFLSLEGKFEYDIEYPEVTLVWGVRSLLSIISPSDLRHSKP
jgi:hypothetical protein